LSSCSKHLEHHKFLQLADQWVDDVSAWEYVNFLSHLADAVVQDGWPPDLKTDDEIVAGAVYENIAASSTLDAACEEKTRLALRSLKLVACLGLRAKSPKSEEISHEVLEAHPVLRGALPGANTSAHDEDAASKAAGLFGSMWATALEKSGFALKHRAARAMSFGTACGSNGAGFVQNVMKRSIDSDDRHLSLMEHADVWGIRKQDLLRLMKKAMTEAKGSTRQRMIITEVRSEESFQVFGPRRLLHKLNRALSDFSVTGRMRGTGQYETRYKSKRKDWATWRSALNTMLWGNGAAIGVLSAAENDETGAPVARAIVEGTPVMAKFNARSKTWEEAVVVGKSSGSIATTHVQVEHDDPSPGGNSHVGNVNDGSRKSRSGDPRATTFEAEPTYDIMFKDGCVSHGVPLSRLEPEQPKAKFASPTGASLGWMWINIRMWRQKIRTGMQVPNDVRQSIAQSPGLRKTGGRAIPISGMSNAEIMEERAQQRKKKIEMLRRSRERLKRVFGLTVFDLHLPRPVDRVCGGWADPAAEYDFPGDAAFARFHGMPESFDYQRWGSSLLSRAAVPNKRASGRGVVTLIPDSAPSIPEWTTREFGLFVDSARNSARVAPSESRTPPHASAAPTSGMHKQHAANRTIRSVASSNPDIARRVVLRTIHKRARSDSVRFGAPERSTSTQTVSHGRRPHPPNGGPNVQEGGAFTHLAISAHQDKSSTHICEKVNFHSSLLPTIGDPYDAPLARRFALARRLSRNETDGLAQLRDLSLLTARLRRACQCPTTPAGKSESEILTKIRTNAVLPHLNRSRKKKRRAASTSTASPMTRDLFRRVQVEKKANATAHARAKLVGNHLS
jgi:hypothetical protein